MNFILKNQATIDEQAYRSDVSKLNTFAQDRLYFAGVNAGQFQSKGTAHENANPVSISG